MKKLLGLLAIAPLTLSACNEADGGAGGKSMTHIKAEHSITSKSTEQDIAKLFGLESMDVIPEGVYYDLACYIGNEGNYFELANLFDLFQVNAGGGTHTIVYPIADYYDHSGWYIFDDPKGYLREGAIIDRVFKKLLNFDWCE